MSCAARKGRVRSVPEGKSVRGMQGDVDVPNTTPSTSSSTVDANERDTRQSDVHAGRIHTRVAMRERRIPDVGHRFPSRGARHVSKDSQDDDDDDVRVERQHTHRAQRPVVLPYLGVHVPTHEVQSHFDLQILIFLRACVRWGQSDVERRPRRLRVPSRTHREVEDLLAQFQLGPRVSLGFRNTKHPSRTNRRDGERAPVRVVATRTARFACRIGQPFARPKGGIRPVRNPSFASHVFGDVLPSVRVRSVSPFFPCAFWIRFASVRGVGVPHGIVDGTFTRVRRASFRLASCVPTPWSWDCVPSGFSSPFFSCG